MSVVSQRVARVLLFSMIALFLVLVLLALVGPPASASGEPFVSSDQPSGAMAGPAGHHGHCREEGSMDGGVLASDSETPSAPPATTREPVPVGSRPPACSLGILAGIIALAAFVVLRLTGRLR